MTRLRLLLNLRTAVFGTLAAAAVAVCAAVVWANQTGMPAEWRRTIERELAKHGTAARIGSLRYVPFHGIIARDVELFAPDDPGTRTAHIGQLLLDLDLARLLRGTLRLERIELSNARVTLTTLPDAPDLVLERLNARVLMNAGRVIEVRDATGRVGGVALELGARILGYRMLAIEAPDDHDPHGEHRALLARIAREIERWEFDPDEPPRLRLFIEGELDDPAAMHVTFDLRARNTGTGGHLLDSLEAAGEVTAGIVAVESLRAADFAGSLEARGDYDLHERVGSFAGRSNLELARLLDAFLGLRPQGEFAFASPPEIDAEGGFRVADDTPPSWHAAGTVAAGPCRLLGHPFDAVRTSFATRDNAWFLRDLELHHPTGSVTGKALVRDERVRFESSATVPLPTLRKWFRDTGVEPWLHRIHPVGDHSAAVDITGSVDLADPRNWACAGRVRMTGVEFRGVPLFEVSSRFSLNPLDCRFEEIAAVFDDRNYPLRRNAPSRPAATARAIHVDPQAELTRVERLDGEFWPAQLAALVDDDLADELEKYRFHTPPAIRSGGVVDMRDDGARTDIVTEFRSTTAADYDFLGRSVTLAEPVGRVRVRGDSVEVDPLGCGAFGGRLDGRITVTDIYGSLRQAGEFHWSRITLPNLADTWKFDPGGGGLLTGRVEYRAGPAGVRSLSGTGSVALEDGELFTVPLFGPLSHLISGVLGGARKIGFEHARNAFCTFTLRDGLLLTRDFHSQTPSADFTGDATVDLDRMTIDMTVRMDARGLLGVITLPLKPFAGFFQFRGTGRLDKPTWRRVMFTAPDDDIPATPAPPRAKPTPPAVEPAEPTGRPQRSRGRP